MEKAAKTRSFAAFFVCSSNCAKRYDRGRPFPLDLSIFAISFIAQTEK